MKESEKKNEKALAYIKKAIVQKEKKNKKKRTTCNYSGKEM